MTGADILQYLFAGFFLGLLIGAIVGMGYVFFSRIVN